MAAPRSNPPRPPRSEPVVDIRPPGWFVVLARAAAGIFLALGLVAAVAGLADGDLRAAVISTFCGSGLAAMAFDASTRSAASHGDELVLHQWFRPVTLQRSRIVEFNAARASFVRWDIVAEPDEGTHVRLWVTRMLPAGRRQRQAWLAELEAWRTWAGPRAGPPTCS